MSRRVFFRDNEAQGFSTYGLLLDTLFRQLKTVGVAGYFPYEYQEDMRCGYAELVSFFGEEFGRLAEQEGDTSNLSILSKHVSLRGMLLEKYRKDNERYLAARNSLSIKSLKKAEEVNEPSWDKLYASAEAEDARGEEGIKDSYEGKPDSAVVNSFLAAINGAHAVDDSSAPAYVEDDEEPVGGYFSDEDEEYSSELPDDDDAEYSSELPDDDDDDDEYSSELPDDDDEEYSSELPDDDDDDDEYSSELPDDDDEYSSEFPDDDDDEYSSELPEDDDEYSSELPEDDEDGEGSLSEFPDDDDDGEGSLSEFPDDDDDEGYSSELPEDDEGDPSELPEDGDEDSSELPEDDDDEDSSELPADDDDEYDEEDSSELPDDEYDDEDSSELPEDDDDEYDDEDSSELPEDDDDEYDEEDSSELPDDEYDEEDSSELPDDEDSSELSAGYSSNLPAGRAVSKPRVYVAPVVSNMVVRPSYARGIPGRETQEAVLDMMDRLANNIKGWFSRL